jgi:hypothetical protein
MLCNWLLLQQPTTTRRLVQRLSSFIFHLLVLPVRRRHWNGPLITFQRSTRHTLPLKRRIALSEESSSVLGLLPGHWLIVVLDDTDSGSGSDKVGCSLSPGASGLPIEWIERAQEQWVSSRSIIGHGSDNAIHCGGHWRSLWARRSAGAGHFAPPRATAGPHRSPLRRGTTR